MKSKGEIVVVEDDEDKAALIITVLRKHLTEEIRHFENGEAALSYILSADAGGISLVLLDLILPGIDGVEIFKRLKADQLHNKIPVMILTSSTQTQLYVESLGLQPDGYVAKPSLRNCA